MVLADVINKISNWWVANSPALGNGMAGLSTFHSDNLISPDTSKLGPQRQPALAKPLEALRMLHTPRNWLDGAFSCRSVTCSKLLVDVCGQCLSTHCVETINRVQADRLMEL